MRSSDSSRCVLGASVRRDQVSKAPGVGSHTLLPAPLNSLAVRAARPHLSAQARRPRLREVSRAFLGIHKRK